MFGAILSFVAGLAGKILASLFGHKDPTPVELAASNATAQTELAGQEIADASIQKADATRIAADADLVHVVADAKPGQSDADTAAAIKRQFPDAYD